MDAGCFMEEADHGSTNDTSGSSVADSRGVYRAVRSNDSGGRKRSAQRGDVCRFRGPGGGIGANGVARGLGGACGVGAERGGRGRGALSALWVGGGVLGEGDHPAGGALALRSSGCHSTARALPLVWRFFFPLRFVNG